VHVAVPRDDRVREAEVGIDVDARRRTGTPIDIAEFPRTAAFTIDPAGAGIVSTVRDTLDLLEHVYGPGDLSKRARKVLADDVSTLSEDDLLLDGSYDIRGHGGASPGAQTIAVYDRRSGVGVVVWCNRLDPGEDELLPSVLAARSVFELLRS